ncbi:hypothetical protein OK016_17720 [Vibrio chagasii]|nr:hypothetical protein [Vibrio chagasii]
MSKVDGNTYLVEHCVTPTSVDLKSGRYMFDYRSTYCEITCRSNGPICIEHCGEHNTYAEHPAYQSFGRSHILVSLFSLMKNSTARLLAQVVALAPG